MKTKRNETQTKNPNHRPTPPFLFSHLLLFCHRRRTPTRTRRHSRQPPGRRRECNLVKPIIQETLNKWRPPQKGFYKLNVDGRWKGVADAGGGGVVRTDEGAWVIGFSASYHANTPCAAELMALRDGLKLARDHKITLLEVETDAKNLKNMFTADLARPNHSLLPIIADVASLLKGGWVVIINHAPRSANELAHHLARLAMELDVAHTIHIQMPDSVAHVFSHDLENAAAPSHSANHHSIGI